MFNKERNIRRNTFLKLFQKRIEISRNSTTIFHETISNSIYTSSLSSHRLIPKPLSLIKKKKKKERKQLNSYHSNFLNTLNLHLKQMKQFKVPEQLSHSLKPATSPFVRVKWKLENVLTIVVHPLLSNLNVATGKDRSICPE